MGTAVRPAEPVHGSIQPIPSEQRALSGFDLAVLWGDLGIGLLVLVTGALLVPGLGARPAPSPLRPAGRRLTVALAASATIFAVAPLAVVAAVPVLDDNGSSAVSQPSVLVPVDAAIAPTAAPSGNAVELTWQPTRPGTAAVFYRILRRAGPTGGLFCAGTPSSAADDCRVYMDSAGTSRTPAFVDHPGPGTWTYRVGVAANWLNDVGYGDVTVVSRPVKVTVH